MESVTARQLRRRVDDLIRDWQIDVDYTSETESSLIVFGARSKQPVVMKVLRIHGDEGHSGEILDAFEGRGVVRLYDYVEGAVLLERLNPGNSLVELSVNGRDDEATDILAEVIDQMSPRQSAIAYPTVRDWAEGFERYIASGDNQIPKNLVEEAYRLYLQLCDSQTRPRLLHGDLHHSNVLVDSARGWLAIDPKGVVGELEYELGAALRNPCERPELFAQPSTVERRLTRFAARLHVDVGRALSWGFAQAVLSAIWGVEDGFTVDVRSPSLELAQVIRPMLGARA